MDGCNSLLRVSCPSGRRLVEMAVDGGGGGHGPRVIVARLVVPLADVLIHVALELASERSAAAAATATAVHVVQLNVLGLLELVERMVLVLLSGRVYHHHGARVGPVRVVAATGVHLQPVPLPAVGVPAHATLDGHQERADRQH